MGAGAVLIGKKGKTLATLHLMIGLPCSGKSTAARALARRARALLLSLDAAHIALFGDDTLHPEHDARHARVEAALWPLAAQALRLGVDVVLDYGLWARAERDDYRARARALGAHCVLHSLSAPRDELLRRLRERNAHRPSDCFTIPESEMEHYFPLFERPTPDETGNGCAGE